MSSVDEVRWRLLRERLAEIYGEAQHQESEESETLPYGLLADRNTEILLRLAGTALALLEWHAVDGKGRCRTRGCARRRWTQWRKQRICPVFATVLFWMEQPLRIAQRAVKT